MLHFSFLGLNGEEFVASLTLVTHRIISYLHEAVKLETSEFFTHCLFFPFLFFLQAYDPELFSKALPCLSAIGCALSPDYSLSHHDDSWLRQTSMDLDGAFHPRPVDTSRLVLQKIPVKNSLTERTA